MKLTADSRGRLTSAELFRPGAAYEVIQQPDGSLRLVELVQKQPAILKARRVKGRWRGADIQLSRETIAAAIRAERDDR